MSDKDFQAPEQKTGTVLALSKKGTAISTSATGLALVINWVWTERTGKTMPPDVAIVLAGGLAFLISWVVSITNALLKKAGITIGGE